MSSFDGIANKFDKNIYGTSKGKIRHALLLHYLDGILNGSSKSVLDLGGGTGMMSYEFAQKGHQVTLVDVSADVLDIAKQRLADFPSTNIQQQPIEEYDQPSDIILCHAVLEWLDNPYDAISHMVNLLPSGGFLSLSFFNYHAMLFNNILYRNFDYIKKGMKVKNQVRLNPKQPLKPEIVMEFIKGLKNIKIVKTAGIRCFHDYIFDKGAKETDFEEILALEKQYGESMPYQYLGKYFYCLLQKEAVG
ncbi:methyltransferase domain-containing protein [Glaciecola sp. 1036]|uniref:methyltransferase domain-containing protein n=1 Tax=Alteromonadaceae TaxID=72275 RepID=UPI003CFC447E